MKKITNKVGSPFDVQTLSGPAILPAFGSLEAEFDSGYLQIICVGGHIFVDDTPVPEVEPDLSELQAEYRKLSGKDADKRWSEKRLADEIAKIKKG